jgi:F-type H+-transporting ATPase subunit delta
MSAAGKRYARAAVEAAIERAGVTAVEELSKGIILFQQAYAESAELREIIENPSLKNEREDILKKILAKVGAGQETINLVLLLAKNNRMAHLDDVVQDLLTIADEKAGRLRALVKSAIALSPDQEKRIAGALQNRLGKPVSIETAIDPSLLGGLVCQVGDLTLDNSVKRQLELVRDRLQTGAA